MNTLQPENMQAWKTQKEWVLHTLLWTAVLGSESGPMRDLFPLLSKLSIMFSEKNTDLKRNWIIKISSPVVDVE